MWARAELGEHGGEHGVLVAPDARASASGPGSSSHRVAQRPQGARGQQVLAGRREHTHVARRASARKVPDEAGLADAGLAEHEGGGAVPGTARSTSEARCAVPSAVRAGRAPPAIVAPGRDPPSGLRLGSAPASDGQPLPMPAVIGSDESGAMSLPSTASEQHFCRPGGCAGLCTEEGLAAAYAAHGPRALARARRIVLDPHLAEEAVQEAFTPRMAQLLVVRPDGGPLLNWLLAITANVAIDLVRARMRRPPVAAVAPYEEAADHSLATDLVLMRAELEPRSRRSARTIAGPFWRRSCSTVPTGTWQASWASTSGPCAPGCTTRCAGCATFSPTRHVSSRRCPA